MTAKVTYHDSLAASDAVWQEGRHDHLPFTGYLLGVVLAAYRELERDTATDLDHGHEPGRSNARWHRFPRNSASPT